MYQLVKELLNLPPANRNHYAKKIQEKFFNPDKIDVFTEQEAVYNATLLRKSTV